MSPSCFCLVLIFVSLFQTLFSTSEIERQSPDLPVFKVLVTGFEPFLDYPDNPSGDVAVALNGSCIQFNDLLVDVTGYPQQDSFIICFEGWLLPVNETGSNAVSNYLLKQSSELSDWAAIVHLGLENSSLGLKIETVGANILATNPSFPAVPGAPSLHPTTTDLSLLSIPELLYLPYTSELVSIHGEPVVDEHQHKKTCTTDSCGQIIRLAKTLQKTNLTLQEQEEIGEEVWSRDAGTYYCNETFFRTLNVVRTNEIHVSPQACTFSSSGKINNKRKRKFFGPSVQTQETCWSTPSVGMVPVQFVHLPDPSNVELETSIQLVSRIAAFMVLPNSLRI